MPSSPSRRDSPLPGYHNEQEFIALITEEEERKSKVELFKDDLTTASKATARDKLNTSGVMSVGTGGVGARHIVEQIVTEPSKYGSGR